MSENDSARKRARARLALRAERALGLDASAIGFHHLVDDVGAKPQAAQERADQKPLAASHHNVAQPVLDTPVRDALARDVATALFVSQKDEPFTATLLPRQARIVTLQTINETEVKGCPNCRLCETRTNTVFGEGDPEARIMFVGEGPGEEEDKTGRPFVGRAGQLLDKMIAGMGLAREQVYIANVVKCRPPGNRVPAPDEAAACMSYLTRQIEIVRPDVIVTLGLTSAKLLLETKLAMGKLRGNWQTWRGVKVMPTFHPAYLLRNFTVETRQAVWGDLKAVLLELKMALPTRGK